MNLTFVKTPLGGYSLAAMKDSVYVEPSDVTYRGHTYRLQRSWFVRGDRFGSWDIRSWGGVLIPFVRDGVVSTDVGDLHRLAGETFTSAPATAQRALLSDLLQALNEYCSDVQVFNDSRLSSCYQELRSAQDSVMQAREALKDREVILTKILSEVRVAQEAADDGLLAYECPTNYSSTKWDVRAR